MTKLTDILATPPVVNHCRFAAWLNGLTEEEQLSVKKALLEPAWSIAALHDIFRDAGLTSDRHNLSKHRKGECKYCGPI